MWSEAIEKKPQCHFHYSVVVILVFGVGGIETKSPLFAMVCLCMCLLIIENISWKYRGCFVTSEWGVKYSDPLTPRSLFANQASNMKAYNTKTPYGLKRQEFYRQVIFHSTLQVLFSKAFF